MKASVSGLAVSVLMAAVAAFSGPARAQLSNLPPEITAKIAAMGPTLNRELIRDTFALFAPLPHEPLTGIEVKSDVAYGEDARQKLDIFQPANKPALPVIVIVPGGGFVGGDKKSVANVGGYFARQGFLSVTINYRLAPQHPWPAGAQDLGKAIAWIKANAGVYHGDPNHVFVFGQSAGAPHVASYIFDPSLQPQDGPGVVAAVLVSGFFQVDPKHLRPEVAAYFGDDASQYESRSPASHVAQSRMSLFLATAEYDPPFLAVPTYNLAAAVCQRDKKCPSFAWLKGHNHISTVASFNTADEELGRKVVDFLASFPK